MAWCSPGPFEPDEIQTISHPSIVTGRARKMFIEQWNFFEWQKYMDWLNHSMKGSSSRGIPFVLRHSILFAVHWISLCSEFTQHPPEGLNHWLFFVDSSKKQNKFVISDHTSHLINFTFECLFENSVWSLFSKQN